jgi:hypothetical protein
MPEIRYTRSCATASWIDERTGLPEFDESHPPATTDREFLTRSRGYRFSNFIEVWAVYDSVRNRFTRYGFTRASGIYRPLSYGGIPSQVFDGIRRTQHHHSHVEFTQTIGARTQSPERIGGMLGGPAGNILASAITAFPPIWTEVKLRVYRDGQSFAEVTRHSLFPSMTFYTREVFASGAPDEQGNYSRTRMSGAAFYNGNPNLERWKDRGWGHIHGGTHGGPTAGNPWGMEESIFSGIDPTQPFGW